MLIWLLYISHFFVKIGIKNVRCKMEISERHISIYHRHSNDFKWDCAVGGAAFTTYAGVML